MSEIIPLHPPGGANAERNQKLFDWALAVLDQIGIHGEINQAQSLEELRGIKLDVESAEVILAIRDALHPARGTREKHFEGLKEGSLKHILRNQFADLKKRTARRHYAGASSPIGPTVSS